MQPIQGRAKNPNDFLNSLVFLLGERFSSSSIPQPHILFSALPAHSALNIFKQSAGNPEFDVISQAGRARASRSATCSSPAHSFPMAGFPIGLARQLVPVQ